MSRSEIDRGRVGVGKFVFSLVGSASPGFCSVYMERATSSFLLSLANNAIAIAAVCQTVQ